MGYCETCEACDYFFDISRHEKCPNCNKLTALKEENAKLRAEIFKWQSMEHNKHIISLENKFDVAIAALKSIADNNDWPGREAIAALAECGIQSEKGTNE